jgi:hypothetical protein
MTQTQTIHTSEAHSSVNAKGERRPAVNKSKRGLLKALVLTEYGCGILVAPSVAILWAAQILADRHGVDLAKKELASVNRYRERMGVCTAFPSYGDRLF